MKVSKILLSFWLPLFCKILADLNKRQFQYHFDKYSVKNLNINDSIKSNCSCDKSWDELEAISEKGSN